MTVRTYMVQGVEMKVPAYVHRTADGWKIALCGFSRTFADMPHGGAAESLKAANILLDKILRRDPNTLYDLYSAQIRILEGASKTPNQAAEVFFVNSRRQVVRMPASAHTPLPALYEGMTFSMKNPIVRDYFSRELQQAAYEYWCDELKRSMKLGWKREISAYLKHFLTPQQQQLQLEV